jgi:hypothetical protein
MTKKANGEITSSKLKIEQINEALRWVIDLMEWCQIPVLLLGDTAEKIWGEKNLDVDKLEFGVMKRHITQDTSRLLKTFVPGLEWDNTIQLSKAGVPIFIRVIQRKYRFFENPDFKYYMADEYKLPNPMNGYLKARWLIR